MRLLLTWLLAFCLLGVLHGHPSASRGPAEICGACGMSGTTEPSQHHDDPDGCPSDHHHHSCCCSHPMPVSAEIDFPCLSENPETRFCGVRPEGDLPPEEPLLGRERPPLI